MRTTLSVLVCLTLAGVPAWTARAQTAAPTGSDSATTDAPAPKHKGLFGKMKGLAKSKVVKTAAKVALCTAVPGGQMIAGAMDAADAKSAAGAAGAAAGATGAGANCMPGMGGMKAKAVTSATAGVGEAVTGASIPSMPTSNLGAPGMSAAQMKQFQEQYKKMGMDSAQIAAMQQAMGSMPGAAAPGGPAAAADGSLGPALTREKGRMVLRQLPWVPGSETLRPDGGPIFGLAIRQLAQAMAATASRYKIEARVEDQGGKSQNRQLARKRANAVVAALVSEGIAQPRLSVSDGGSDKDVRIVVSEAK